MDSFLPPGLNCHIMCNVFKNQHFHPLPFTRKRDMIKNLKIIGICIICLATGIVMFSTAITEPDLSIASRIASVLIACLFILFSFAFYTGNKVEMSRNRKKWKDRNNIFSLYETVKDKDETDLLLSDFRKNYAAFFTSRNVEENSPFQLMSTQLFWNITALKKKRLDARKIKEEFYSERKAYDEISKVCSRNYFDGIYDVTEFDEGIAAKIIYQRAGKPLLSKTDRLIAHYVMTDVKAKNNRLVICPNCGAATTRENLIDGCDYCGTKFLVEDLQQKIAAFCMRSNYQIQYEKYRYARSHYSERVFTVQFIIWALLAFAMYVIELPGQIEEGVASVTEFFSAILASAFFAGCMAFLGTFTFWTFIFPFIQAKASIQYIGKRFLEEMKQREQMDNETEKIIRECDPNFSIQAFYSNLQNKLATIHFGDTKESVLAFFDEESEKEAEKLYGRYSDVIDMDMEDISVEQFKVENGFQHVNVKVLLTLFRDKEKCIKKEKEFIRMELVRKENGRKKTICGPAVFTCKGCGSSLALETGKTCVQCGRSIDLKAIDWAIVGYTLKKI